jgi:hypothetical protein
MKEQNKTIWELPPREPVPRRESSEETEHSDRKSEGNNKIRHQSKHRRSKHAISEE